MRSTHTDLKQHSSCCCSFLPLLPLQLPHCKLLSHDLDVIVSFTNWNWLHERSGASMWQWSLWVELPSYKNVRYSLGEKLHLSRIIDMKYFLEQEEEIMTLWLSIYRWSLATSVKRSRCQMVEDDDDGRILITLR